MYDGMSEDYDYFVNWQGRLAFEMPCIEAQLQTIPASREPLRVLDAACGTGMHTIELRRRGYQAAGADLSRGMIAKAVKNASQAGVQVRFEVAGFGELAGKFSEQDALLCLGNSLPHLLTPQALSEALRDFAACLRPGGLLLIQNRNFDLVMEKRERWMNPESQRAGEAEYVFLRFYDFDPDGLISFHIITLQRSSGGTWQQKIASTRLYPQRRAELEEALRLAGFGHVHAYGSLGGEAFEPGTSGNLVISARLGEA
jgi:SAM-dependent methyltransferase